MRRIFILWICTAFASPSYAENLSEPCENPPLSNTQVETFVRDVVKATQGVQQHSSTEALRSCQGLPEVRDPRSFDDAYVSQLLTLPFSDNLIQASCRADYAETFGAKESSCPAFHSGATHDSLYSLQGGLILSNARFVAQALPRALEIDKRVSDLVSTNSVKNLRGLCDVVTLGDYTLEQIRECLKMPGMIGVGELQLNAPVPMLVPGDPTFLLSRKGKAYDRLIATLELLKEAHGRIIEIHFNNSLTGPSKDETQALLEIASRFPQVEFVILHSGINQAIGKEGLKTIGKYYQDHPSAPRNIWTDNSAAADLLGEMMSNGLRGCETLKAQAELAETWRAFGIRRVVFGSDIGFGPGGYVDPQALAKARIGLLSNPFLSQTEKIEILSGNFKNLISGI